MKIEFNIKVDDSSSLEVLKIGDNNLCCYYYDGGFYTGCTFMGVEERQFGLIGTFPYMVLKAPMGPPDQNVFTTLYSSPGRIFRSLEDAIKYRDNQTKAEEFYKKLNNLFIIPNITITDLNIEEDPEFNKFQYLIDDLRKHTTKT